MVRNRFLCISNDSECSEGQKYDGIIKDVAFQHYEMAF